MTAFSQALLGAFILGGLLLLAARMVARHGPSQPIRGRLDLPLVLGTLGGLLAACCAVIAVLRWLLAAAGWLSSNLIG